MGGGGELNDFELAFLVVVVLLTAVLVTPVSLVVGRELFETGGGVVVTLPRENPNDISKRSLSLSSNNSSS